MTLAITITLHDLIQSVMLVAVVFGLLVMKRN
jgi:hypothetical protein